MNTRSRSYCFTINHYDDDDLADLILLADQSRYMIIGFEQGEKEETPHIQGYVYFENQRYFKSLSKLIPRAYIATAKGNPKQNYDYCTKEGNFYEHGELPISGRLTYDKMKEIMKDPESNPFLYQQYRKTYEAIQQHIKKKDESQIRFFIHEGFDPITTIFDYFDWNGTDKVAVVHELWQLEAYNEYDHVVYYADFWDKSHDLWARGMPICYKNGYEVKIVKPKTFVIVSSSIKLYSHLYTRI